MSNFAYFSDHPDGVPLQTPVTVLDLERTGLVLDMNLPMADPCPTCGAFNMCVGDWVCLGHCGPCEGDAQRRSEQLQIEWLQGQQL